MQSNNPVFRRSPEFSGSGAGSQSAPGTYPGAGAAYGGYGQPQGQQYPPYQQPGYGDPAQWGTGMPPQAGGVTKRMTIDSVVQATGISLFVVIATAFATWWYVSPITAETAGFLYLALIVGSGGAFVLSLVNSFKRVISPALVLIFAAFEGVALGALSLFIEQAFVQTGGLVMTAVLGTFAAFAGTLAAYKFFNIQVSNRFRTFVIAAVFGMVALSLLSLVLSLFGVSTGLFGFGTLGMLTAIAGLVLGVFMLILDFDFVEKGIAFGLDERESWRAAFAMTVSLVWIYTNLLRLLAIFNSD